LALGLILRIHSGARLTLTRSQWRSV